MNIISLQLMVGTWYFDYPHVNRNPGLEEFFYQTYIYLTLYKSKISMEGLEDNMIYDCILYAILGFEFLKLSL